MSTENELRYFDALKEISIYDSPEWLRRNAEKQYGLSYEEALEMAYENIRNDARLTIKGKRRPKVKARQTAPPVPSQHAGRNQSDAANTTPEDQA